MNHFVPDFDREDDYSIPTSSSSLNLPKKSAMAEDEIMELLWQNGQVVMRSQSSQKKSPPPLKSGCEKSTAAEGRGLSQPHQQPTDYHPLFMEEDEMSSWLQYPVHEDDFCSHLLYTNPYGAPHSTPQPQLQPHSSSHAPPSANHAQTSVSQKQTSISTAPPSVSCSLPEEATHLVTADRRIEKDPKAVRNFGHFSRFKGSHSRIESWPSVLKSVARESIVVNSRATPAAAGSKTIQRMEAASGGTNALGRTTGGAATVGGASSSAIRDVRSKDMAGTCEVSVTSSSGEPAQPPPPPLTAEHRKRKGGEADETECHSEDVKEAHGSTSTKRSRAAEVHNLSERRRRDRINEKMRALQELIPRCNKSDKASMLDDAIEYLKSLQLQVQMMSMGCGMVPMMYHYNMPHVMMGLGMDMGMNRPIMPFPNVLTGSTSPTPVQLGGPPRFPIPPFLMPSIHPSDPNQIQAVNQIEPMPNSFSLQNPNQPTIPSFPNPYPQFLGLHQMQVPPPKMQNQATDQPSSSTPSTGKETETPENHQSR